MICSLSAHATLLDHHLWANHKFGNCTEQFEVHYVITYTVSKYTGACIIHRRIELERIGNDQDRDAAVSHTIHKLQRPVWWPSGCVIIQSRTMALLPRLLGIPVDLFAFHGTRKAGAWRRLILHIQTLCDSTCVCHLGDLNLAMDECVVQLFNFQSIQLTNRGERQQENSG